MENKNNNSYEYGFDGINGENGNENREEQRNESENMYAVNNNAVNRQNKKKSFGIGKTVALVLTCALVSGAFGAGGMMAYNKLTASGNTEQAQTETYQSSGFGTGGSSQKASLAAFSTAAAESKHTGNAMTASEVYAANVNSTVGITTSINTNYFGYRTTSAASGSGFIITADGYVVTNYHVVDGANTISVAMYDGKSYDAELIGYDESNDVALLKIDAEGLTPVTIGNSDNILVGEDVIAIGNPLGELTFSLTKGVISALDREITMSTGTTMNLMQTDCAINSGNSGGALFNMYGEVIGITNAKYSSSGYSSEASIDNIGFAIPMNQVVNIIDSIMKNGYVSKPYIGVTVGTVDEEMMKYGVPAGASVQSVEKDSPAEKAGIAANDIIVAADGNEITSSSELSKIISSAQPGQKMTFKLYRQGEYKEVTAVLGEKKNTVEDKEEETDEQQSSDDSYNGYSYGYGNGNGSEGFGNYGDFGDIFEYFFGNGNGSSRGGYGSSAFGG